MNKEIEWIWQSERRAAGKRATENEDECDVINRKGKEREEKRREEK